jgi:hypothetical protein
MKTASKFLPTITGVFIFCIGLAVTTVLADHGGRDHGGRGNDDEHLFEIELSMMPTADAPAGSSARLTFEAENEDGTTQAELKIKARNLAAGTYTVNAVLKSDGSTVTLGSFTVDNEGEGEIEFGHDEGVPFPANIDPLDVASVNITAVNGVVLFTVDLSNLTMASSMNISESVQATPGAGNPNATGNVSVSGFVSGGRVKGSLQISGHGLPTNTQAVVTVNGMPVKNVHTNKTGDLNVKISPQGKTGTLAAGVTLAGVTIVAVVDRNGNVLLQANL